MNFIKHRWIDIICIISAVLFESTVRNFIGWEDTSNYRILTFVIVYIVTAIVISLIIAIFNPTWIKNYWSNK